MALRRVAISCVSALLLAGCGGGGTGSNNFNPFAPFVPPPTSATTTQSITPAGGAIATTLNGQLLTVTFPPGAFAAPTSVTVTVYLPTAGPKTVASTQRAPKDLPSDVIPVLEFKIDAGSTPLLKAPKASAAVPPPLSGSVYRLAGFGTNGGPPKNPAFNDVDTMTFVASSNPPPALGTVTEDNNPNYAGPTLANGTYYALYVTAKPASPPAFVVTPAGPAQVGPFGTAKYTASSEADANGFPYLGPTAFVFSLDNPSMGSITASGTLTTGAVDVAGNVVAKDTVTGGTGKLPVGVSSQRPGNASDTFTFTGTLSSTTQQTNSNITTVPQTDTATVAMTSTVKGFTPSVGGGQSTVHSDETDTYPLQTIKTGTDSTYTYAAGASSATLSIVSSDAKDSGGAEYINTFGTGNGLLDVLPEAQGSFGPNNAALTYQENDPANFARHRVVAANGSYLETGTDALNDTQTITVNTDFSAFYDATQYSGFNFTITAPSGTPKKITVAIKQGSTPRGSLTITSWIPAAATQPSAETDVDNGSTAYPAGCKVPAKYGTSGNQIVQTINRVDAALGNLESLTTTTYTAPGVGPVCIQLNDLVQTFYDYTLQNGFVLFVSGNAQPIQLTSVSETLTLQSAATQNGTTTQSLQRSTASVPRSAFAPVAYARARFEHAVRERLGLRKETFNRNFMSNGVQAL